MKAVLRIVPRVGRDVNEAIDWPASPAAQQALSRRLVARFDEAARANGAWPVIDVDGPRDAEGPWSVVWQIMVRDGHAGLRHVSAFVYTPGPAGETINFECPVCQGFGVLDVDVAEGQPVPECPLCTTEGTR